MEKTTKYRNFAFLLYPESCKSDFRRVLEELYCPVYYVLHDKDTEINIDSGEVLPKKSHYHVMITFPNPRSEKTAQKICLMCGGSGHVKKIASKTGYARYLMHLDDEGKHKYSRDEINVINDNLEKKYDDIITINYQPTNANETLAEIIQYCKNNSLIAYCELIDYCVSERLDWLPIVKRNSHLLYTYIKSANWYRQYE